MQRKAEMKVVDPNYFDLFDLEIIAGKPLTQANVIGDQFNGFVVNEALIKSLERKHLNP